jgi:hypothetical protein
MTEAQNIIFNLDHVIETLRKGVRRADVFMGFGLNAAEANPVISHVLSPDELHNITFVKDVLSPAEQEHLVAEFAKWVRANGLRELIETFSLFLDQLYMPLFAMKRGKSDGGRHLEQPERFERLGIVDKINAMSAVLPVVEGDKDMIRGMNRLRNCYAHRLGVVGERDVDSEGESMTIHWQAFQLQVEKPDGTVIMETELYGQVLEQGGVVQLKVVERARSFEKGSEVVLEKRELKEICLSALSIGERLLRTAIEQAREAGAFKETK